MSNENSPDPMEEVCINCGCNYGAHHGGIFKYPLNYCPGHQGKMDWDMGGGTIFEGGKYFKQITYMTTAINIKR